MALSSRVAQFYGYAVCLVAVVTMLIAIGNVVDAAFDRSSPLLAAGGRYGGDRPLTSFEVYRATGGPERMDPARTVPTGETPTDTLSTAQLRARYEALRADRLERVAFESSQRLVKHGVLLLLAIVLFFTHWRWLRGHDRVADAG
jgi:hypothetical protein